MKKNTPCQEVIKIVQSSDNGNSNGNGQKEYNPEVEFEYLDSDVWIGTDDKGNKTVAYIEDVKEALEEGEEPESGNSSN